MRGECPETFIGIIQQPAARLSINRERKGHLEDPLASEISAARRSEKAISTSSIGQYRKVAVLDNDLANKFYSLKYSRMLVSVKEK